MTSMAVKPATDQEQVTEIQSLTLMRNLLRTGISTICYMRDIFPEEEFSPMEFNNCSIMALRPKSEDANELTTWLEKGAFDAIKLKYLERLVLVIFEGDPAGADAAVLEEHSFSVRYPHGDSTAPHTIAVVSKDHSGGKKTKQKDLPGSKSAVKKETTIFIRTLITVMQTMEPLPDHRYVSMRLHYNHSCPDDYEPECFRSVNAQDVQYFKQAPTTLAIGDVKTSYHQLTMKVKAADFCEANELEDADALGAGSPKKSTYHHTPDTHQDSTINHVSTKYLVSQEPEVISTDSDDTFLEAVQWAQRQDYVQHTQLAKQFNIPPVKASEYCRKMFNSGILGQIVRGRRAVIANQLQADTGDEIETQASSRLAGRTDSELQSQAVAYASTHEQLIKARLAAHLSVSVQKASNVIVAMRKRGLVGKYQKHKGARVNQEALSQHLEQIHLSEDQIDDDEAEDQPQSLDEIESSQQNFHKVTSSARSKKRTLSDVLVPGPQSKYAKAFDATSDSDECSGNGIVQLSQDSMNGKFGEDASADEMKMSVVKDPIEQVLMQAIES